MKPKKSIILGFIILLLLIITFISRYGGDDMRLKRSLNTFSKLIENGKLNDLSLTIYYIEPDAFTNYPLSVEDLIKYNDGKIVVEGSSLEEHVNLLKQIKNYVIIPVEHESRINARIYYVFETKKKCKIFDVSMWGSNNTIFVNGIEVKENDIFYDVIIPFLPEDVAKELEGFKNKGKQE